MKQHDQRDGDASQAFDIVEEAVLRFLGLGFGLGFGLRVGLCLGLGRLCRDDDRSRMPVYAVVRWYWGSGGTGHPRQLHALGLGRRAAQPRAIPHGRFFPVRSHEEIVVFPQYGRNRR
jgi:hypothetical protein